MPSQESSLDRNVSVRETHSVVKSKIVVPRLTVRLHVMLCHPDMDRNVYDLGLVIGA